MRFFKWVLLGGLVTSCATTKKVPDCQEYINQSVKDLGDQGYMLVDAGNSPSGSPYGVMWNPITTHFIAASITLTDEDRNEFGRGKAKLVGECADPKGGKHPIMEAQGFLKPEKPAEE